MSKRTYKHVARQITVYGMEKDKLRNLRLKLDIEFAETTHSGNVTLPECVVSANSNVFQIFMTRL